MRSLKEEINYCRQRGFHRNTIELNTLASWLGNHELEMLEAKSQVEHLDTENHKLRAQVERLKSQLEWIRRTLISGQTEISKAVEMIRESKEWAS